jgi:hypothetical protein
MNGPNTDASDHDIIEHPFNNTPRTKDQSRVLMEDVISN